MEVESLVEKLEKVVGDGELSADVILSLTITSMQLVEKVKNLKGQEKKDLVLNSLEKLIEKKGGDYKEILKFIPKVIDNFIGIENGEIKFTSKGLFPCCK